MKILLINGSMRGEQSSSLKVANAFVEGIIEENGIATKVILTNGEEIEAKHFISNIHPVKTLELVKESKVIRNIYRKRITNIPNTYGMFTANIQLKKEAIPYLNRNQFFYETSNIWDYHNYKEGGKASCALAFSAS